MGFNLLTGVLVGLVALAIVLIVILLVMDRGRSQSPAEYRRARELEAAREQQVRGRRRRPGSITQADDEMPRLYDL